MMFAVRIIAGKYWEKWGTWKFCKTFFQKVLIGPLINNPKDRLDFSQLESLSRSPNLSIKQPLQKRGCFFWFQGVKPSSEGTTTSFKIHAHSNAKGRFI